MNMAREKTSSGGHLHLSGVLLLLALLLLLVLLLLLPLLTLSIVLLVFLLPTLLSVIILKWNKILVTRIKCTSKFSLKSFQLLSVGSNPNYNSSHLPSHSPRRREFHFPRPDASYSSCSLPFSLWRNPPARLDQTVNATIDNFLKGLIRFGSTKKLPKDNLVEKWPVLLGQRSRVKTETSQLQLKDNVYYMITISVQI